MKEKVTTEEEEEPDAEETTTKKARGASKKGAAKKKTKKEAAPKKAKQPFHTLPVVAPVVQGILKFLLVGYTIFLTPFFFVFLSLSGCYSRGGTYRTGMNFSSLFPSIFLFLLSVSFHFFFFLFLLFFNIFIS